MHRFEQRVKMRELWIFFVKQENAGLPVLRKIKHGRFCGLCLWLTQ